MSCAVLANRTMSPMPEAVPASTSGDQTTFRSGRRFQVWKYDVGHRLLVLRSVKDGRHATRVDVLFLNTAHLNLPTSFTGLLIEDWHDGRYRLSGDGWEGEVRAGKVAVGEDHGEY